jgi:hypothetical protein
VQSRKDVFFVLRLVVVRRRRLRRRRLNCVINIPDIYCFEGKRGTFEVEREQEQKKKMEMEFSKLFVAKNRKLLIIEKPSCKKLHLN